MDDQEFLRLIDDYLDAPAESHPEMAGIKIVWERDDPEFGAKHMWDEHRVTEQEVEQVLLEIPPYVEAKRRHDHRRRTIFWGRTRLDRAIFVVCEDWVEGGLRFLKPITAFEPGEGEEYWERYR